MSTKFKHVQVVVACADWRVNPRIKEEIEKNEKMQIETVPLRVAAIRPGLAKSELQKVLESNNNIVSILLLQHSDCKYEKARLDSIKNYGLDLDGAVINPNLPHFGDMASFERYNAKTLLEQYKDMVSGHRTPYEVRLEYVDVSPIKKPDSVKQILEVGSPDSIIYQIEPHKLVGRYMLSATQIDESATAQIAFFVQKSIVEEITFVATKREDERAVHAAAEATRIRVMLTNPSQKPIPVGVELRAME